MPEKRKEIAVGGQAVIEGVMMRGPEHISTCIRRKDGSLELKKEEFISITQKNKLLGLPILRGFTSLIEMMIIGIRTLTFAANRYELDYTDEKEAAKSDARKKTEEIFSYIFSFGLAIALFGAAPYYLGEFVGKNNMIFNLSAGLIRIVFFVTYIWAISKLKDVNRLFRYHGAEHKSVFAWENKAKLDAESVQKFKTLHPRCGTSFIFLVLLISILFYAVIDTVVKKYWIIDLQWWQRLVIHFPLIPIVSGISYEVLKFSGKHIKNPLVKLMVTPGLGLQLITTQPPTDEMIECAVVAMKSALDIDISDYDNLTILESDK